MHIVKIVISGAVNAGKTAFVRTISEISVATTERRLSHEVAPDKTATTVALDFGRITIGHDLIVQLFGTPGQPRFDFMWDILARGMAGLLVLVDSTQPRTFRDARHVIDHFDAHHHVPFIIAANKQDLPGALTPEDIRLALHIPSGIDVLPCIASDRESALHVLRALIAVVQRRERAI